MCSCQPVCFQYPPCGSSRCNDAVLAQADAGKETFSTLHAGRVAATPERIRRSLACKHFQYPPCGSSRCNHRRHDCCLGSRWSFQYPPCGSSRCNSEARMMQSQRVHPFSTLHAGRVAATQTLTAQGPATVSFQYPPCGSSRCNSTTRFSIP